MNEIEISNKAFNLAHRLRLIQSGIADLIPLAKNIHTACSEYCNGDITPADHNIDPIPNTPFVVVYRPNEGGEIRGIYCRGVDVTDYLDDYTLELAEQLAIEAVADEKTANQEWSSEQKFEAQRLGE